MDAKHATEPWAVGEYWSSSHPHVKVLVLSVGGDDIAMCGVHHSFVRWVFDSEQAEMLTKQRDQLLEALRLVAAEVTDGVRPTSADSYLPSDVVREVHAAIAAAEQPKPAGEQEGAGA